MAAMILTASAGAQISATNYHYSYFKEAMPLRLDLAEVAMIGARPERIATLELDAGNLRDVRLKGLAVTETPAWAREDKAYKDLVAALTAEHHAAFVSPVFRDTQGHPAYITPDLIVAFDPALSHEEARKIIAAHIPGEIVKRDWAGMTNTYIIRTDLTSGFEVLELANALAQRPDVVYAQSDMVMTVVQHQVIPDDQLFNNAWGLRNIGQMGCCVGQDMNAPMAWTITTGSPDVIVAILDNGVQQNHPDINQIPGIDISAIGAPFGGPGNACDNHGTAVAGCVSGIMNNWIGACGIAPNAKVMSIRYSVSSIPCNGTGTYATSALVEALDIFLNLGGDITVNSNSVPPNGPVTVKYAQTRELGLIHFASAGNDGANAITYPANIPSVNAVGAVTQQGLRWINSNYGAGLAFVAPGVQIQTTDRTNISGYNSTDYVQVTGTSFAAPYAAGVAALIKSRNPGLPPTYIEQIMQNSAVDRGPAGYDPEYGYGFVNAYAALLITPPPIPPGNFNILSPAPGGSTASTSPLLDWSDSDNAQSYRVIIDDDADLSSPFFNDIVNLSQLQTTAATFTPGITYYWSVIANNFNGSTTSNPGIASFTVINPAPTPGAFSLIAPAAGATDVGLTPLIDWSDSANAISYTLTIDTDAGFNPPATYSVAVGASQHQMPQGILQNGVTYYWKVTADNLNGSTPSTPASRSFTVVPAPPACGGDANGDLVVDGADLSVLLTMFGQTTTPGNGADFNNDGIVDGADLSILLSRFGISC